MVILGGGYLTIVIINELYYAIFGYGGNNDNYENKPYIWDYSIRYVDSPEWDFVDDYRQPAPKIIFTDTSLKAADEDLA